MDLTRNHEDMSVEERVEFLEELYPVLALALLLFGIAFTLHLLRERFDNAFSVIETTPIPLRPKTNGSTKASPPFSEGEIIEEWRIVEGKNKEVET